MNELNVRNRTIFHGDNLEFLRGINSETIHLIATDPPFKKGRDFHATPGSLAQGASFKDRWSWEQDVQGDWVDKIKDDWPAAYAVIESTRLSYGEDMSAFLCWLGVRLMEMRRVLRADGSLYLHIDQTAGAYAKALLDAIFGARNFRNEITWRRIRGAGKVTQHKKRTFGPAADTILFYAKSKNTTFNIDDILMPYSEDYMEKHFKYRDSKGIYGRRSPFNAPGQGARPNQCYEYKGFYPPHPSGWNVTLPALKRMDADGDLEFANNRVYRKQRPRGGVMPNSLWLDINAAAGNERMGYPTQKPLALYERIIKASSNEGDFVLDPFCGCATTPIAAERLKRQWIGMDIWDKAHDTVLSRLERNNLAVPTREQKEDQPNLFTFGDVTYSAIPPTRTDDNEIAAPRIKHKIPIPKEKWEMLSHKQMKSHLAQYQQREGKEGLIVCAGCGRELEVEFMELDHISPKSDGGANSINNRILICRPCNGRKSNGLTLTGLHRENKREKWMQSKELADFAKLRQSEAVDHAKRDPDSIQV